MKYSVVIPARNEEASIGETLAALIAATDAAAVATEIIVVDDGSTDGTADCVCRWSAKYPFVRLVENSGRHGFGMAIRTGLQYVTGEAVAIVMADGSDSAADVVTYYRTLQQGYDCVFGSRFIDGARVLGYPPHKLLLNRFANWFIRAIFGFRFNDITNAFKCYRREVIDGVQPLISPHFNLTVEIPLKAIVRGYTYAVVPICWTNRKAGVSKLKIKEMGSRYLFIVMYIWLEKMLARGDYHRRHSTETETKTAHV